MQTICEKGKHILARVIENDIIAHVQDMVDTENRVALIVSMGIKDFKKEMDHIAAAIIEAIDHENNL